MAAKYSIKRNSLSSKWGVWANGTEASSTVEKLLVELRTQEDAEAYCARLDAGESHDAIVTALSAKKPKKEGGGLFGRFRKGASEEAPVASVNGAVNNPVIEIETPATAEDVEQAVEPEPAPAPVAEAPSRFQVIEQPKPQPAPVVESQAEAVQEQPELEMVQEPAAENELEKAPGPVAEVEPESAEAVQADAEGEGERVKMHAKPSSLSNKLKAAFRRKSATEEAAVPEMAANIEDAEPVIEQPAPEIKPAPVTEVATEPTPEPKSEEVQPVEEMSEPVAEAPVEAAEAPVEAEEPVQKTEQPKPEPEPIQNIEPEPVPEPKLTPVPEPEPVKSEADSALVDWTFTPPPDVTPEELKASGFKAPEAPTPEEEPVAEVQSEAPTPKPVAAPMPKATAKKPVQVDPELSQPAAKQQAKPATPPAKTGTEKRSMTVEIGISKALKDVTIGDPRVPDKKYNKVASQEYTEVSKAYSVGSPDKLHEELIHLAAVCLAWADAIEKRRAGESKAA